MAEQQIISIIVPVYNAENFLPQFFDSFSKQTILNENVELLLIDNGSTDQSKHIIEKYMSQSYRKCSIRYLYFDKVADSYAARNYGVKESKGEIIAFTDSDCILESDWIEQIYNSSKKNIIISGEVEIQVVDKKNIWEVFDSFAHLNNKENAPKGKVATANLIVNREDYTKVGNFEERFSGGDHDWSLRAKNLGLKIQYIPNIKVYHPSRKKYSQITTKSKRMAYGAGINHSRKKKSFFSLILLYSLKIFNFKTNIRYSKEFKRRGFGYSQILKFNLCFMRMRFNQLIASIQGYRNISARKLNIK